MPRQREIGRAQRLKRDMARAFGGYGERITEPDQIVPAIQRGLRQTQEGHPALLEFITQKETQTSEY